jgi:hypothetical protein
MSREDLTTGFVIPPPGIVPDFTPRPVFPRQLPQQMPTMPPTIPPAIPFPVPEGRYQDRTPSPPFPPVIPGGPGR